jgi:hypothetical protein
VEPGSAEVDEGGFGMGRRCEHPLYRVVRTAGVYGSGAVHAGDVCQSVTDSQNLSVIVYPR